MNIVKINNRVNLITEENKKFKTFTVSFYFHNELDEKTASEYSLLPYVLKSGSKGYPDMTAVSNALEALYGGMFDCSIRKKGEDQIVGLSFEFLSPSYAREKDYLENVWHFISDMLFNPLVEKGGFNSGYTKREKNNLIDYIDSLINDKKEYANHRCTEEMCKGDNYAVFEYGKKELVEKITPEILYNRYLEMIKKSRVDIFVMGNVDIKMLEAKIKELNLGDGNAIYPLCDMKKESGSVKEIKEAFDVNQGKISMGFTYRTDDRYALTVFNSVFGSGAHSKLFNNVREKLSLCYYAYSRVDSFKGIMKVNSGVEFENFKKAYDEILVQLNSVCEGKITPEELEASKKSVINNLKSLNDSLFSYENYILNGLVKGEITDIDEYIEKINSVTKEDIMKVAKTVKLDTVYYLTGGAK